MKRQSHWTRKVADWVGLPLCALFGAILMVGVLSFVEGEPAPVYFSSSSSGIGKVVKVEDGDTVRADHKGTVVKYRLAYIDAPEFEHWSWGRHWNEQPFAKESKRHLELLVMGRECVFEIVGTDTRNKRPVCVIYVKDTNVNRAMVRMGYAWEYPAYSKDDHLKTLQAEAKKAGRGLWKGVRPVPPWLWRQGKDEARKERSLPSHIGRNRDGVPAHSVGVVGGGAGQTRYFASLFSLETSDLWRHAIRNT